ncbi:MAG: GspL/Epsl periplasmic domain-containing protein [Planctomycetota bacterium]
MGQTIWAIQLIDHAGPGVPTQTEPDHALPTKPDDGSSHWRVIGLPDARAESPEALAKLMASQGWRGQPVLLVIPSRWCLCACIPLAGLPRQQREQAMLYRFEEMLPFAAEQATADFLLSGNEAMGVGTATERLAELVSSVEHRGVPVQWICPLGMLLQIDTADQIDQTQTSIVLQDGHDGIECFCFEGKRLRSWQVLSNNSDAVRLAIKQHRLGLSNCKIYMSSTVADKVLSEDNSTDQTNNEDQITRLENRPIRERLQWAIDQTLGKSGNLPINLRRGELEAMDPLRSIRWQLNAAAVVFAALLVLTCGLIFWKTTQLQRHASGLEQQQRQVYQETFPGTAVPLSTRSRMDSEARRLKAVSGTAGDIPDVGRSLNDLHALLSRLPDQLRYRINEARLDRGELFIDGEARAHSDVDAIAVSLRKQKGFAIDPPRIERLSQREGVRFTLSGKAPVNSSGNHTDTRSLETALNIITPQISSP